MSCRPATNNRARFSSDYETVCNKHLKHLGFMSAADSKVVSNVPGQYKKRCGKKCWLRTALETTKDSQCRIVAHSVTPVLSIKKPCKQEPYLRYLIKLSYIFAQ